MMTEKYFNMVGFVLPRGSIRRNKAKKIRE